MSAGTERNDPVSTVRNLPKTNGKSCLVVLLFGASLSLLNACSFGQAKDIDPNQPVKPTPQTGIIVGSVTAPMVQHYWKISHFRYRKTGESKSGVLASASPMTDFLWIKGHAIQPGGTGPDPGLEHQLGRVFAVELMAGTYEIYQLDGNNRLLTQMQPARFVVRPGEIQYLGNLHVRYCLYKPDRRVYRSYVSAGIPSVRDESTRDLPLLRRKFPALSASDILPAVIDDSVWQELQKAENHPPDTEC